RSRRRHRRLRLLLPVDADPRCGRSGGEQCPPRRDCLARAGIYDPAGTGAASALAGARGRCRAPRPPGDRELHQRRRDGDGPRGRWELEALELSEPAGLAITNGHQNSENPAGATQFRARVTLGPLLAPRGPGQSPLRVLLGGWRGVGAASTTAHVRRGAVTMVHFVTSGTPGVLRPAQPTDTHPVPVLADPQTAASAGPGG